MSQTTTPKSIDTREGKARLRDVLRDWTPAEQHVWLYLRDCVVGPSGLAEVAPEMLARDTRHKVPTVKKALASLAERQVFGVPAIHWHPEKLVVLVGTWRSDCPVLKVEHAAARVEFARTLPQTDFIDAYIAAVEAIGAVRANSADEKTQQHKGNAGKDNAGKAGTDDPHTAACRKVRQSWLYQSLATLPLEFPALVDLHPEEPIGKRLVELQAEHSPSWGRTYAARLKDHLDDRGRLTGVRHGRGEIERKATLGLVLSPDVIAAVLDRTGGTP